MDFTTFLHMNGYATYVWGAYGIGLVAYLGVLLHTLARYERLRKQDKPK